MAAGSVPAGSPARTASFGHPPAVLCRVTLRIDHQCVDADTVCVLGECEELGMWQVDRAIAMSTATETGPHVWTAVVLLPVGLRTAYKYIVVRPRGENSRHLVEWEAARGASRSLVVEGKEMYVPGGSFGCLEPALQPWVGRGWLPQNEFQLRVQLQTQTAALVPCAGCPVPLDALHVRLHDPLGLSTDMALPAAGEFHEFIIHAPAPGLLCFAVDLLDANNRTLASGTVCNGQLAERRGALVVPLLQAPCVLQSPPPSRPVVVAVLHCGYLVVVPFVHPQNTLRTLWQNIVEYPKSLIGHRGCGKNHGLSKEQRAAITENTILSFVTAHRFGAEMVEFDIQLTFDDVPVLFHDPEILVPTASGVQLTESISRLTLDQFLKLQPARDNTIVRNMLTRLRKIKRSHSFNDVLDQARHVASTGTGTSTPNADFAALPATGVLIHDRFSTFEETFSLVPPDVGFMIELKYPTETFQKQRNFRAAERNRFVDIILKIVFDKAGDRRIVFQSFDPDITILLRTKQFRYPVMFLIYCDTSNFLAGDDPDVEIADNRGNTARGAIAFAKSVNLDGIVCDAEAVLKDHSLPERVHKNNMMLFSYGSLNTNSSNVELQKRIGVDGIIADNVAKINKTSNDAQTVIKDFVTSSLV